MKLTALVVPLLVLCTACSAPAATSVPAPASTAATTAAAMPLRLMTHCGIREVDFLGRHWTAINPQPEPMPLPAGGVITPTGYTEGLMTLVGPDLARFVVTDPHVVATPGAVDFQPGPAPVSQCT